nr:TIGR03086 family metal-binding protein [Streptomyces sp. NBC_00857]
MFDLGPACREVAGLLGGISDDQLAGPTPCPDYAVREVLGHLVGLTGAFRDAARKELGPTTDTAPNTALPVLDTDWREVLPRQLNELAAAWRSPAAWEGFTRIGGVDLPGAVAGIVALNEVQLHGWDLARSTGQAYAPDEASLRASYAMLAPMADPDNPGPAQEGLFGPPVRTPEDAPLLDQVVGLSGRRPDWRPGE